MTHPLTNTVMSGTYTADNFADWCSSINAGRCYVCNWPLKEAPELGCVVFNCSERPLFGDKLERAHIQEGIATAIHRGLP